MAARLPIVLCFLGLLLTAPGVGAVGVSTDTTIAGQTYTLLSAEDLLARLQKATAPIRLRATAIVGRLYAPTAGLDTVRAALHFEEVLFLEEVTLNNVVFLAPVYAERTAFASGLSLLGAHFQDSFVLRASRSGKHLNLKRATFAGAVDLSDNHFAEPSTFIEAHFTRQARFARTRFGAAAYFEGARFDGPAEFRDAHFAGVASFKDAVWRDSAIFAGVRFDQRALFWRARFLARADFAAVRADGEFSCNGAVFADRADFADFTFAQAAHFADVTFDQAAFQGSYFRKEADFSGVEARTLRFRAFFSQALDLRHAVVGTLDLRQDTGADSTFAQNARIYLQQSYFDRVLVRWSQLRGRLAVADSASFDALEPAYASLRHHFLQQGLEGDAEDCQFERLENQRRALELTEPKRWAMELWRISSRYGTDPTRLVISILSITLLFGLCYRLDSGAMRPVYGEGKPTMADCIGFSIYTFTHAGYRAWYATGKLKLLASIEALLGWVSLGLLIAVALAHLL